MTLETFFRNFFSNPEITNLRFRNFMRDVRARFEADNTAGRWDDVIHRIDAVLAALDAELGAVDATANIGKGQTIGTDEVLAQFEHSLSEEAPFIRRALKGEGPGAYLEFYPTGMAEYHTISKTTAPILLKRIATAAAKWATQLGKPLSDDLIAFEKAYNAARDTQVGNMGELKQNRNERSAARVAAEPVMLTIMHEAGARHPGDVAAGGQFFHLSLLYPTPHADEPVMA